MAISNKLISLESIVESAQRDYDFYNFNWEHALEWTGETLRKIGSPKIYVHKSKCITIEDYRGILPDDLLIAQEFRDKSTGELLQWTGEYFHKFHCTDSPNCSCTSAVKYQLDHTFIFTSEADMEVELSYFAFPVDDRGFPLIPDNDSVKEAVKHSLIYKNVVKAWVAGKVSDKVKLHYETEYDWYIAKAISKSGRMELEEVDAFKNAFKRFIPKIETYWKNKCLIEESERIYTKTKRS